MTDSDPHGLFFGSADDDQFGSADDDQFGSADGEHQDAAPPDQRRPRPRATEPERETRVSRRHARIESQRHTRTKRNRRLLLILAALLVVMVVVATWLVVLPIYRYFNPSDYSGAGTGRISIQINPNDGAGDIGKTLHDNGVVASVRAFTDAADDNDRAQNIQPGTYVLHKHMSAEKALALLLDPVTRENADVVVTEGATTLDVVSRLTAKPCSGGAGKGQVCGPGLPAATVRSALKNVKALGLPTDYTVKGAAPASVEGFLYPATYFFPSDTAPGIALQQMITKFTREAKDTNFTARAKSLGITPYQELIVASIAQAEAKFPEDFAKVARVILNRLAGKKPLQIDATSAYAAKLKGLDPTKEIYAETEGPYNTYRNDGLPPTPISNPGADAMDGAAHPTAGNWLFYVNGDADGHLYFTNSAAKFQHAVEKCRKNNWGCG